MVRNIEMEKYAKILPLAFLVGILLTILILFWSKPTPKFSSLTIAYTNEIRGEIEPCG
jgi:hypothetical protein